MLSRIYVIAVLALWVSATAWLVWMKIVPSLHGGTPPGYTQEFTTDVEQSPPPVAWDITWNDRPVGHLITCAVGTTNDPREIRSYVKFEKVKFSEIMQQLLGGMAFLATSMSGNQDFEVNLTVATQLHLTWDGELDWFESLVRAENSFDLARIRGFRTETDQLRLSLSQGDDKSSTPNMVYSHEVPLPTHARFAEVFSPRSKLVGLTVGQRWTTPEISPFSTTQTVRLVESVVEAEETMLRGEAEVKAFRVAYRYSSGGTLAREPVGLAWVKDDGSVIRQQLKLGSATLRFERVDEAEAKQRAAILEGGEFERLFRDRETPASPTSSVKEEK